MTALLQNGGVKFVDRKCLSQHLSEKALKYFMILLIILQNGRNTIILQTQEKKDEINISRFKRRK